MSGYTAANVALTGGGAFTATLAPGSVNETTGAHVIGTLTVWSAAQANNVTQIILGKARRPRWFEILHGSVVHELVRRSGNISVHVIAGEEEGEPVPGKTVRTRAKRKPFDAAPYGAGLLAVVAALGVGKALQPLIGVDNVDRLSLEWTGIGTFSDIFGAFGGQQTR